MKKKILLGVLGVSLILGGCGSSANTIEGVYADDYFDGYSFSSDGTVIYYESNWYKPSDEPSKCEPEYWYGTYTVDDKALTIVLSGVDEEITGVIMDENIIVIDGAECEKMEKSYIENGADDESWAVLDEKIGLN